MRGFAIVFVCGLLLGSQAWALSAEDIQLSGFGNVGMVLSDSEHYGYRPDFGYDDGVYRDDVDFLTTSNIGLQLDTALGQSALFTLQAVLRDQSGTQLDRYISQAFLKLQLSPSVSFKLGRVPVDLFALTEYQSVNFAFPWSVIPQEVYGIFPLRQLDGVDLAYTFRPAQGSLRAKIFAGRNVLDVAGLGSVEEIKFDHIYGASLQWSAINWELKANYSQVEFVEDSASAQPLIDGIVQLADVLNTLAMALPEPFPGVLWENAEETSAALALEGTRVEYQSVSGHYYWGQWALAAEVSRIASEHIFVPEVYGGYINLAYASGRSTLYAMVAYTQGDGEEFDESDVSPLLSQADSSLIDPALAGPALAAAFNALLPAYQQLVEGYNQALSFYASNQTTYSIGWRYDFKDDMSLNLQWSHTQIDENGGTLWIPRDNFAGGESVNTVFCNVSFVF